MTAVWLQIGAGLVGVLSLWLREYYSKQRTEDRYRDELDQDIQELRQDIVDGDADAVAIRLDRLPAQAGGGNAGVSGVPDQSGGAVTYSRLGAFGISVVKTSGSGREE